MLENGFPIQIQEDAAKVIAQLPIQLHGNAASRESDQGCSYRLIDGQQVTVPCRVYCEEIREQVLEKMTPVQKMICHAIYSRSDDGFVRQKHLRSILAEDYPDWMIPYIVKLADEYVLDILELLYESLKTRDNTKIKIFWQMNIPALRYSHARMISYWDVFYREDCFEYRNYIGKKLFEECFGYTRSMEKMR